MWARLVCEIIRVSAPAGGWGAWIWVAWHHSGAPTVSVPIASVLKCRTCYGCWRSPWRLRPMQICSEPLVFYYRIFILFGRWRCLPIWNAQTISKSFANMWARGYVSYRYVRRAQCDLKLWYLWGISLHPRPELCHIFWGRTPGR